MNDLKYSVLFTHQKAKKAKIWRDGTLKILTFGTKAVLYDDIGSMLDVLHLHSKDVQSGEQFETDRYLILVEEKVVYQSPISNQSDQSVFTNANTCHCSTLVSCSNTDVIASSSTLASEIKRKQCGFIPPRSVEQHSGASNNLPISPVFTSHSLNKHAAIESGNISGQPPFLNSQHLDKGTLLYEQKKDFTSNCFDKSTIIVGDANDEYTTAQSSLVDMKSTFRCLSTSCQHPSESHSLLKTAICKVNSSSMHDGPSLFNNFCNPNVKRQCLELHASGQGTPLNYLRTTTVEQDVDVGSHEKQNVLPHARKSLDHLTCCGSKKMYAENSTGIIGSVQLGLSRPVVRRSCNDILSLLSQKNDFKFPVSANWESKVTSAINKNGFSMLNMAVISGESSGVANNFMERECLEDTVSQNEGRFDSRQFSKALLMDSSLDWLLPNVAEKDADCDKHAASPVQAVPAAEGCKFVSHNHSNHIHLLNCCKDQTNTKMTMYCNAMAFMNEITSVDNIAQPVLGNTHLTDISVKAPDVTYSMCTLLPLATDFLASSSLPVPLLPDQLSPLSSQGISLNCMLGSMDAGSNNNVIDSTCGVVYGKRTQMLNTGDDVKISCFVCEASQNIDNLEDRASFSVPDSYSIANSTNNDLLNESVTPVINLNGNDVTFLLDLSPVSADPQSGKDNLECTFDQSDDKSFRKDCEPMSECCLHSIENFSSDASYVGDQRSVAHNDTKNGQNLPTVDKAHEAKGCEQPSNQDAFVNVASQVFFGVFQQDGNDSGCPALYSVPSNRSLATENAAALDASLLANDNEDVMSFSSSVEENYLCSQHKLPSLNSSEVMHNLVSSTLHNIKTLDDLCISPDDLSPHQHTVVSSCSGIDYGQNGHMAMCGLENTEQCRNNDGATGFSRHQVNMSLSDDIVLDAAASFSNADVHSVLTSELIDGICSQSQIDVACTTSDIDTAIVSLSVFPTAEPLPFTASMTAIHSENGKIYCERTMSPVFHHKRICPVVSEVFSNKFPKLSSHTDFTENVSHEHNQVHIQSTVSQETNCVSQMFPSAVFSIVPDNITGDNLNVVMSGSDNEATNAMKETGSVFIDGEHENKSFNEILYSDELCDKVSLSNLSFSNEYFSYSDIKVKKNHSKPLLVQCFTKPPTGSMENSVCLNPSIDDIGYTCCRTSLDNKCFTRMLCTHSESPFNSSMSNRKMCSEDGITELWSPAVCVTCMKPSAVEHDLLHNAMVKLRSYQMSGTVCGKLVHYSSAPTCNPQCDIFSKHSDCDTDVMSSLDCSEMLTAAKTDSSSICSDEFRHRGLDLLNDFSLSESYFCSPESAFKWNDTSVKYNSGMFSIALNEDASKKFSDRFTSQHLSEESLCSQNCSQPLRCASCCHNIDIDDGLIKDRKAIIKKFPLLCQQVIDVTPIATESHSCVDVRMRHFDVDRAHFPGRMTEGCKTVLSNDLSPQLYSQIDDVMTINGGLCLDDNALTPFCNLTGSEVNVSLIENTNRQFVNQVNCQTNHLHIPDIVNNNGYGNGMNEVTTCSVDIFGLAGLEYEKDHTVVKESNFSTSEFSGFDDSFSESVSNNVEQDICVRHTKNCNDMLHVPVEKNCLSSVYISNGNGQMLFKDIDQESFVSNNTLFSDKHASSFVSNSILDSAEDSCMSNAECVTPHVGEVMLSTEIKATIKWKRASKCFQSLNSVNSLLDVLPTSVHILPTQMLHEGILKLTECELDDFLVPSAVIDSPPLDICCQSNLEDLLMSNNVMSPATNLAAELIQCIPVSNSLNAPRNELKSVEVKSFDFSQDIPLVYISNDLSPSVSESHNNNEIRLCTGTPGTLQGFKPPTQIDPSITKKYYDQADKDYTCSDGWSYSEFKFPGKLDVDVNHAPLRRLTIPITFNSPASYRNVLLAALTEYLNIQLFEIARTYHLALEKVDINSFIDDVLFVRGKMRSAELLCKCGIAAKVLQVRKEGPNKGRFFYACSIPREKQCRVSYSVLAQY